MIPIPDQQYVQTTLANSRTTAVPIYRRVLSGTPPFGDPQLSTFPVAFTVNALIHQPESSKLLPLVRDHILLQVPVGTPITYDDRIVVDGIVWRMVDRLPKLAAGFQVADVHVFEWYSVGSDPSGSDMGGSQEDYGYIGYNCFFSIERDGSAVAGLQHKRAKRREPVREEIMVYGQVINEVLETSPGLDLHHGDIVVIEEVDGHGTNVDKPNIYQLLNTSHQPSPEAKIIMFMITGGQ